MLLRLFRRTSLFIGGLLLLALLVAIAMLLVRLTLVSLSDPVTDQVHLEAKQSYLASLPAADPNAPNIVIIFFDDLGWGDLSSYGNALIETPQIDAIAAEGLRMTSFYSASPVCTPSRAGLLTGRFPPRTRTDQHVFFPDDHAIGLWRRVMGRANALPREEITVAEVLQSAGYRTGLIGKWHLGEAAGHRPNDFGFESFYGVLFSNDMFPFNLYRNDEVLIEDQRKGSLIAAERDETSPLPGSGIDQRALTGMYTDEAISFLEKADDRPFFLYLAHSFPHVPLYASEDFANTSRGGTYGDVVEDLDRSTGAVMAALARLGLAENTLVIITSDNGADYTGSPGYLRGRKGEVLEGGQRVPMIARWPGKIAPGRVSSEMAMATDLFPTLLNYASLPLPQDRIVDGRSLTGYFSGEAPSPHTYLYYFPVTGPVPIAVRNDRLKLLENSGDLGRNRNHVTLLTGDAEAHDVQNLYPAEAGALRQALADMQQQITENNRGWIE
ncbi:MAG: sulfatase [Gammaproteobacteria bacterium]